MLGVEENTLPKGAKETKGANSEGGNCFSGLLFSGLYSVKISCFFPLLVRLHALRLGVDTRRSLAIECALSKFYAGFTTAALL